MSATENRAEVVLVEERSVGEGVVDGVERVVAGGTGTAQKRKTSESAAVSAFAAAAACPAALSGVFLVVAVDAVREVAGTPVETDTPTHGDVRLHGARVSRASV